MSTEVHDQQNHIRVRIGDNYLSDEPLTTR